MSFVLNIEWTIKGTKNRFAKNRSTNLMVLSQKQNSFSPGITGPYFLDKSWNFLMKIVLCQALAESIVKFGLKSRRCCWMFRHFRTNHFPCWNTFLKNGFWQSEISQHFSFCLLLYHRHCCLKIYTKFCFIHIFFRNFSIYIPKLA